MTSEARRRERQVFEQVLDTDKAARGALLAELCGGDATLRARVEALLRASESQPGFLPPKDAASADGPTLEKSGDWVGRYRLLEVIGEGGCGVVYMAEQQEPVRRRVALKIIKPGMDTRSVVARFEAERQALALMDHPGIARVFDGGATSAGRPFFVMELVRGVRVTEYCDEQKLSTPERLELFIHICQAVQHAHQKGVVHRDLKPSNILVTLNDGVAVPKVIDFGVAKAVSQPLTDKTLFTQFHALIGTPAYMSPEQAQMSSLDIDTRSDVYSLGVLLYELLTGRTPFDGQELVAAGLDEMRRTLREREPVKPSTRLRSLSGEELTTTARRRRRDAPRLVTELSGDLDWIVLKCLEKERARRYESASALAEDVRRHLRHEPVAARPPTLWYRAQKMARRNRVAVGAGVAITVTLLATASISTRLFFREKSARETAESESLRANRAADAARLAAQSARRAAYAADMQAAQLALNGNNPGRARTLLQSYLPTAVEEDLRGLEWSWLWEASRDEARGVLPHPGIVDDVVFAPHGRWFATACYDGVVRVFDSGTLKSLAEIAEPGVRELAVSSDGEWLAASTRDGVSLRDTARWKLARPIPGLGPPFLFTRDGARLVGREGPRLVCWDTTKWTREEWPRTWPGGSPDKLARLGADKLVAGIRAGGAAVAVVDARDGRVLRRLFGFPDVVSVAGSPDGRWVAAGQADGEIALWDAESGTLLAQTNAHPSWSLALAFSPDNARLVSGGGDQKLRFWEVSTEGLAALGALQGHGSEIWAVEFSPNGQALLSASKDATARLWPAAPAQPRRASLAPARNVFHVTDDGAEAVSFENDGTLRWRGTARGEVRREQRLPLRPVATPLWAGDGTVFAGDATGMLVRWDTINDRELARFRVGAGEAQPVAFTTNGAGLAVIGQQPRRLHLVAATNGASVAEFADFAGEPAGFARTAAISADGRWLAYAGPRFEVKLFDLQSMRPAHSLTGLTWNVFSIAFAPGGRRVAASGWDGQARIWDTANGAPATPPLRGHRSGVSRVEFSADGRTLLTAGEDGELWFWNAANGHQMISFRDVSVTAAPLITPDNRLLILGGATLRLEPLPVIGASAP